MYIIKKNKLENLFDFYKNQKDFFPIIGAILEGKQNGTIYANMLNNPTSVFVVHSFNFAQFIEIEEDVVFDQSIKEKVFQYNNPFKYRIYNPKEKWRKYFDNTLSKLCSVQSGNRDRFIYEKKIDFLNNEISFLNDSNFNEINTLFNLDLENRFWVNKEAAISSSKLVAFSINNSYVSVCYGAADSDSKIEIDVITLEAERKKRYAEMVVLAFIHHCQKQGLKPVWDCYSNNISSYKLAVKLNFTHIFQYSFYILTQQ